LTDALFYIAVGVIFSFAGIGVAVSTVAVLLTIKFSKWFKR
jgi:hypothetical protein